MNKELFIAIIIGINVGVLIALGIWRLNKVFDIDKNSKTSEKQEITKPQSSEEKNVQKIILTEPEENDVLTTQPAKFSGITKNGSLVIISSENKDYILSGNSEKISEFSQEVELVGGVNQVLLASVDKNEDKHEITRTVIYSTELEKDIPEKELNEASDEANLIKKVKEKIEKVRKNPKAFIGVVTDKTQDSFQIKDTKGEIKFVKVNSETTFVKLLKIQTKISFSDVAIGDFVIAMGFLSSEENLNEKNELLLARRVLITEPIQPLKRVIAFGKITSIENKNVFLKEKNEREWKLNFPRSWVGPEIKELSIGYKLIAIGEAQGNTINIRTIHVKD